MRELHSNERSRKHIQKYVKKKKKDGVYTVIITIIKHFSNKKLVDHCIIYTVGVS